MFELNLGEGRIFNVSADEHHPGAFHVRIIKGSDIPSELHLVPLSGFEKGAYYQKAFSSSPKHQGYGTLLIDTLLNNRAQALPSVQAIYSSSWVPENNQDATDFITMDAANFWKKLIQRGLAITDNTLNRFKMIL